MGTNWIDLWFNDKISIINTMRKNLAADIEAGYYLNGCSVRKQLVEIEEYERNFDADIRKIRDMEPGRAKHWCYIDLKRRGVIS